MKYILSLLTLLLSFFLLLNENSQNPISEDCKVLLEEISETYKGDCEGGLADGKGVAKGIDTYKGKFKKGLPDGEGKYTYKNGNVFTGNFKNGLKHGEGKFVYTVSNKKYTQKGFWVKGDYVGLNSPELSHRIILQSGVDKLEINKLSTNTNKIKISFCVLHAKSVPTGLKINSSSGQITQTGNDFFITHSSEGSNFVDIEYVIKKGGQNKLCQASIEILIEGDYEVMITNE